jgi:hypothetical protein
LFNFIARAISCFSSSFNTTKYPSIFSLSIIRLQLFLYIIFCF